MALRPGAAARTACGLVVLTVCGLGPAAMGEVRTMWTRVYNAPTNHGDTDPAIVADPGGAVYVAASCYDPSDTLYALRTIKYSASGELEWERAAAASALSYSPPELVLDSAGNVLVSGRRWQDGGWGAVLLKYSPAGETLVDIYYPLPATECLPPVLNYPALATDADDNILLGWASECDFVVLKFSADGTFLWDAAYGLPGTASDGITDLAVDAAGRVYAIGVLGSGGHPFGVAAFDSAGSFLWSDVEGGPIGNGFEKGFIRVGPTGEVYAGASVETTCGLFQFRAWKYTADGTRDWTGWYTDEPCDTAEPNAMAVDVAGDVVLAGQRDGVADFATVKWNAAGERLWVRLLDGTMESSDVARAVAVDDERRVYTAGQRLDAGLNYNYGVAAYAADGTELWTRTYDGPAGSTDLATGIAANARGVYVTGYIWNGSSTNYDLATIKYFEDQPGDLNCDGAVNAFDVDPFVQALTATPPEYAEYYALYPQCNHSSADINQDGVVNVFDIDPFVDLLAG